MLSDETGADIYLTQEDTLPTGVFKVRGGITLYCQLPDKFHEARRVAALTGNHGQSVASAGREFAIR